MLVPGREQSLQIFVKRGLIKCTFQMVAPFGEGANKIKKFL
jgi:hypothetical protein